MPIKPLVDESDNFGKQLLIQLSIANKHRLHTRAAQQPKRINLKFIAQVPKQGGRHLPLSSFVVPVSAVRKSQIRGEIGLRVAQLRPDRDKARANLDIQIVC